MRILAFLHRITFTSLSSLFCHQMFLPGGVFGFLFRYFVRAAVPELWRNPEISRLMTKLTKWLCVQRWLRSAWASAQSDQSLRCALNWKLRTQAFFMRTAKTLIRLGGCPGWSESSLGALSFCWFCHVATQINCFQLPEYYYSFYYHDIYIARCVLEFAYLSVIWHWKVQNYSDFLLWIRQK